MKKMLPIFFFFVVLSCYSQFSKTHYIPPLSGSAFVEAEEQYIYISTPSETAVNFKIIQFGNSDIVGTVSKSIPYTYSVGTGNDTQVMVPPTEVGAVQSAKGFIVEAEDLVYVTVRLIAGNGNQAGEIVSKGLAALGTNFRAGAFLNNLLPEYTENQYTFISCLATENNTTISFSDLEAGVILLNNMAQGDTPFSVTLNRGQSYVLAAMGPFAANRDALVGSLISSDKPIAVNCGSFGGTNGEMINLDLGFDQIVSAERTGKEYIFIKSTGLDAVETVLLIANEDNTEIFLGSDTTPISTLSAGEYLSLDGTTYDNNGNLFVHTSKNVFAYQSIGDDGRNDQANQELFFVPPLSCETPKIIDNIPFINLVGDRFFNGRITLVTETGSTLDFTINSSDYTIAQLIATGINVSGPNSVAGNPNYVTYTIKGLTGNVSVYSTSQLYLASYGSSDAATFGGYYSGFTFRPEVSFETIDVAQPNCLPNVKLGVSEITGFDTFQWFFNDSPIQNAISSSYTPTQPGYYFVRAAIASCSTELESDKIPVSTCGTDSDGDGILDNIDIDIDNDGITNCTESYGDVAINISNPTSGNISQGSYTNTFTGIFPAGTGTPAAVPFAGDTAGNFLSNVTAGEGNSMNYRMNFAQPLAFLLTYVGVNHPSAVLNSDGEFAISVPPNQTLTVTNPTNQLLIDTNYDGIYESGVTQFSSFVIRFRLNSVIPLAAGSGTFTFRGATVSSLSFTHKNLNDQTGNKATFHIAASCVPKDSDGDGTADALDLDSDNDGLPDLYESQGNGFLPLSGTDPNNDGLDAIFDHGSAPADSDLDGIFDYLDLDSDNNGIYDLVESGSTPADNDNNGVVDGNIASFGANGLANSLESSIDSGTLNYTVSDINGDDIWDYISSDNDGDRCSDVLEAGFHDLNNDGYLGNTAPPSINGQGLVTGNADGYSTPNQNYRIPADITIITQPLADVISCELQHVHISMEANPEVTFKWQVSTDGINFTNIDDGVEYSGTGTNTLSIQSASLEYNGKFYRALLDRPGNICGDMSGQALLHINTLPPVTDRTLTQCDTGDAPDGLTIFNLAEADGGLTNDDPALSVTYFLTPDDAIDGVGQLDVDYSNLSNPQQLIAKVTNIATGCWSLSTLNLAVSTLSNQVLPEYGNCEDVDNEDGFTQFDLTTANIPVGNLQTLHYYETETDALLEHNEINNPETYTNLQPYTAQTIFARLETANSCSRLFQIPIIVYRLPDINANAQLKPHVVCVNEPTFTTTLDAALLDGTQSDEYTYQWYFNGTIIPGATHYALEVDTEGTYSVDVTNANNCTKRRYIPVIASSQAIIKSIGVNDFTDVNTVTIHLSLDSYGDYVYSLDYENAFQESNIFTNVASGIHTVYVKDLNGCPIASYEISVVGIPKFFTPNGDGNNDNWNVRGISERYNAESVIFIFDRYGKLIQKLGVTGGWDGTYNGHELPADDYWYDVHLQDGRSSKGHFALKR